MKKISGQQAQELCQELISGHSGDLKTSFSAISALEDIQPNSLVFCLDGKHLETILSSQATMIIAPKPVADAISKIPDHQCWLFSPNPELAMRTIKTNYFLQTPYQSPAQEAIHPKAHIDPSAKLGQNVIIGPSASIGAGVTIGDNSFVGANTVIENDTTIGKNTTLHPLCYIGHSSIIGNNCEVLPQACIASEGFGYAHDEKWNHYRIPHSGRVILEDNVHVGASTCIDRGSIGNTVIKQGTKIDNLCQLAHNSIIGENSLITAQFAMAGSTTIGKNFVAGGKTSVTGHITITDNVQLGGHSGVTKNITESGQYSGLPLQKLKDHLRTKAALVQLPAMRKILKKLSKA